MARGWLKRKRGSTLFCWYNSEGLERSKVIGPASLHKGKDAPNREAWARVGELGLGKLVAKSDPTFITFGELAEKYLAQNPFNKTINQGTVRPDHSSATDAPVVGCGRNRN
jgi:hypothetical protein